MMTDENPQVRMANDIAVQFAHLPEDTAAPLVADHIRQFWDPRMRTDLDHRADTSPAEFHPLALAATRLLRSVN